MRVDRAQEAVAEVGGAVLGDARLNVRLEDIVSALARRPGESLPKALGAESALEATYRFLGNERVSLAAILAPHTARTVARCADKKRVLVVFDSTELRYSGEREGLGHLSNKGRGLLGHIGLAVSAEGRREPLGVLHCETVTRLTAKKNGEPAKKQSDRESWRWHRGAEAVQAVLPEAICVMDRESDIFSLVAQMKGQQQDFVIRASQNRNTEEGHLWDLLDDMELVTTREVRLAERRARKREVEAKRFPPHSAHLAKLEIRARRVTLLKPGVLKKPKGPRRHTEASGGWEFPGSVLNFV